jgi:transcriptional regulator with XRE-family HTH domain
MLNADKILEAINKSGLSKSDICSRTRIARTTLDGILNGSDARASTLQLIADVLNVNIGCFFDSVESVNIDDHSATMFSSTAHNEGDTNALVEKVAYLESVVAEQKSQIEWMRSLVEKLSCK